MLFLSDPRQPRDGEAFSDGLESRGFTQTLGDAYRNWKFAPDGLKGSGVMEDAASEESVAAQNRLFTAAQRSAVLVEGMGGFSAAREQAYENRIETVRRLTGVTLENPEHNAYYKEAEAEYRTLREQGAITLADVQAGDHFAARRIALQRDIFNRKVSDLAESFPDKAQGLMFGQTIDDQALAIGKATAAELDNARRAVGGDFMTEIAGGITGFMRDPFNLAATVIGGGAGTARSLIGRLAQVALREGAYNAGVEAVQQPAVQDWRRRLELENGVAPALENIGMAFAFGAVIGGGIQGLGEVFGRSARGAGDADAAAVANILRGDASVADVERAAKVLGVELDDAAKADLAVLRRIEADDATMPGAPEGVSRADHDAALGDAVLYAEDPTAHPPPAQPLPASILDDPELRAARPELFADGVEPSQEALGLAALSQRGWEAVMSGEVNPLHASWVGRMAPGAPETHAGLVRALVEAAPVNEAEARIVLRDAIGAADQGVSRAIALGAEKPGRALKAGDAVEPGTATASRQADTLLPAPAEGAPLPPPDLRVRPVSELVPVATRADGRDMRAMSVDDALREASRNDTLGDLVAGCKL